MEACKEALNWEWLYAKAHDLAVAYNTLSDGSLRDTEKHMGALFLLIEEVYGEILDIDYEARQTTRQSDKEVI